MDHEAEFNPADEEVFSEQAIEEAYLQALQASEEAGLIASADQSLCASDFPAESAQERGDSEISAEIDETETAESELSTNSTAGPNFTPEQIIEAILFVGGEKLSARKLSNILGSHSKEEVVRQWVEKINQRYASQNRPYEIQLGEEGYQLVLKSQYEKQRHLVFGIGPREVKLSQDATEVLSFIAYKQPVTKKQLQEIDKPNVQASLRQLIRRKLVEVNRSEQSDEPQYCVTDRFLQLFGLSSLDELPRVGELSYK